MDKTHYIRTTEVAVLPSAGTKLYEESIILVRIVDELGGEFVEIAQNKWSFRIDPSEWESLRAAIDKMIKECRPEDREKE